MTDNKPVPVDANEDHQVHLEMHAKAKDTSAKEAHILAHQEALLIKRDKPEVFGNDGSATSLNFQNVVGAPNQPLNVQESKPVQSQVRPTGQ